MNIPQEMPLHSILNKRNGKKNNAKGTYFTIRNNKTGKELMDCFILVENASELMCMGAFTSECMAKIDY